MAVIIKASRLVPSDQRHSVISEVDTGDEIDFVEILGRAARRIKIELPANVTSASFRLNNKLTMPKGPTKFGQEKSIDDIPEDVVIVSTGAQPLYTLTGNASYYTEEGLYISFIQCDDVTVSSGTANVKIYCW